MLKMAEDSVDVNKSEWEAEILSNLKQLKTESIQTIASDLSQRKRVFSDFIQVLGAHLTSSNTAIRHDGERVVVLVLEGLSKWALNSQEIKSILHFLLARLQDHPTLSGLAIRGLLALVRMAEFDGELAVDIVNGLENVSGFSLQRADARSVYVLFEELVDGFPQNLQSLGSNALGRFIQLMSEESEPRNLLICYRTMAKILHQFPIAPLEETAFDVLACYFPIDFTPMNGEDVQSELSGSLVLGLRKCLTASPLFTKFLIPLILEKLSSDSNDAKVESLRTFVGCCQADESKQVYTTHLASLWASLRREIMASPSDSVEEAAMEALTALTKLLGCCPQQDGSGEMESFVAGIISDTEQFVRKPQLELQYAAGKMLKAVCVGSPLACCRIFNTFAPLCINLFMEQLRTEDRLALMSVMTLILNAAATTSGQRNFDIPEKISIATFLQSLLHERPQNMITCLSITGLTEMLSIWTTQGPFLEEDRVGRICETMMSGVMDYENSGVVDQVVLFFSAVGRTQNAEFIFAKILPDLLKHIQSREVVPIPHRLVSLTAALLRAPQPKRSSTFISGLFDRIIFLDQNGPYVPTMVMYLDLIAIFVEQTQSSDEAESLYDVILFPTFRQAILAATSEEVSGFQDIGVLQSICRIYRGIVCRLTDKTFKTLTGKLDRMFLRGDTSYRQITGAGDKLLPNAFKPLEKPYITTHTRCISLLTSIVCSAPAGYVYEHIQWKQEVYKMVDTCCFCADEQSSIFAAQCIAGIVNRIEDDVTMKAVLGDILEDGVLSKARQQERRYIRLIVWMLKALVLGAQKGDICRQLTEQVIHHLSSRKSGEEAAVGMRIILEESPFVLNAQMNARLSPLYRQRFFALALPALLDSFRRLKENKDEAWIKRNHLVALSHLLKFSPATVTKPALPQVIPFLVDSLGSEDGELVLSTLTSVDEILLDAQPSSPPPFDTQFIPLLMDKLTGLAATNFNMNVRVSAVECLQHAGEHLPRPPILPFKHKVLKSLAKCLDDKKRCVRQVAVVARSSWFLVGTSKE